MFYVIKKTKGQMESKGKVFVFKQKVKVSKEMYKYLKTNFSNMFEFEEEKTKPTTLKNEKVVVTKAPTKRTRGKAVKDK